MALVRERWLVVACLLLSLFFLQERASAADLGLIEPQTLAKGSGWVVLDARPRAEWQAGHLPGARSLWWEDYTRTDDKGVRYRIRPVAEVARLLGEMGLDENTPVVIYGDADKSWGSEGWGGWLFAWLGHRGPVRLLDGGIQRWRAQGLAVATGADTSAAKRKTYHLRLNRGVEVTLAELQSSSRAGFTLIDTRSNWEWLLGRIPGSVHIAWQNFFSGSDRRPLSKEALRRLLREKGVPLDKPIVYYCAGGIRSGYCWTVHQLAGLPPARNYVGGMEEWGKLAASR